MLCILYYWNEERKERKSIKPEEKHKVQDQMETQEHCFRRRHTRLILAATVTGLPWQRKSPSHTQITNVSSVN